MNHKQQETFLLLISFFLFLFSCISCDKTTAPVNKLQLTLTAPYIGVTEADLLLQTRNTEANTQYQLFRDDSLVSDGKLIQAETIITDTRLLPAHHYSYQSFLIKDQKRIAQSEERQVNTLDTTSHNYTWQTFTFGGEAGSCVLYDCAILSEDNIWCAGAIYLKDSLGNPDFNAYNAVHWDGQQWELKRIYVEYRSQPNLAPLEGVFVLPDGNIIFSSGLPYIPEGDHWKLYHLWDMGIFDQDDGSVYRIWGTCLQDLYFVGLKGTIVHYNGSSWQKLESSTETQINDIWGTTDFLSAKQNILAVVSDEYHLGDMRILSVHPNRVRDTLNWNFDRRVMSVWFMNHGGIYVCGSGVRVYHHGKWKLLDLTNYFTLRVRGSAANNIFVVGAFGLVLHYNGYSWHTYPELILSNGKLLGLAVTDNLVVAVGYTDYRGFILTGKRF
jgi:hypothetical protein